MAVATLAANRDTALTAETNVVEVMKTFDRTGSDELAVVAADRRVLGISSETHVRRRYAEELEKARGICLGSDGAGWPASLHSFKSAFGLPPPDP